MGFLDAGASSFGGASFGGATFAGSSGSSMTLGGCVSSGVSVRPAPEDSQTAPAGAAVLRGRNRLVLGLDTRTAMPTPAPLKAKPKTSIRVI